jgi:dihydroorotase
LKHLVQLHKDFPNLKIVLEHVTSAAAVETVKSLGDTVGCTITIHHLELLVDDWAGCCHNFCKPVAKFPKDRDALRQVVKEGHPRFFLGTDSAPHPRTAKETSTAAAGVFVTPFMAPYLVHILESFGALDKLNGFASKFGRQFYGIPTLNDVSLLSLEKKAFSIPTAIPYVDDQGKRAEVVPFLAGKSLGWTLQQSS